MKASLFLLISPFLSLLLVHGTPASGISVTEVHADGSEPPVQAGKTKMTPGEKAAAEAKEDGAAGWKNQDGDIINAQDPKASDLNGDGTGLTKEDIRMMIGNPINLDPDDDDDEDDDGVPKRKIIDLTPDEYCAACELTFEAAFEAVFINVAKTTDRKVRRTSTDFANEVCGSEHYTNIPKSFYHGCMKLFSDYPLEMMQPFTGKHHLARLGHMIHIREHKQSFCNEFAFCPKFEHDKKLTSDCEACDVVIHHLSKALRREEVVDHSRTVFILRSLCPFMKLRMTQGWPHDVCHDMLEEELEGGKKVSKLVASLTTEGEKFDSSIIPALRKGVCGKILESCSAKQLKKYVQITDKQHNEL